MMKNRAARAAGLHYLEYGSMELKTSDKTWKLYGSPVCNLHTIYSNVVRVSDFAQATPQYMPGSFQYEAKDRAGAEGERPLSLFRCLSWTDCGLLKQYINAYRETRRSY